MRFLFVLNENKHVHVGCTSTLSENAIVFTMCHLPAPWLASRSGFQPQNNSVPSYYCRPKRKLSFSEHLPLFSYAASENDTGLL